MKTFYTRWTRIIKHSIQYVLTGNPVYKWEVLHYYYMIKFNTRGRIYSMSNTHMDKELIEMEEAAKTILQKFRNRDL